MYKRRSTGGKLQLCTQLYKRLCRRLKANVITHPATTANIHNTRSGELQNLWYHMDRNKITRQGFRRVLLEATDSLPVTFPASPCPYPAGPIGPASDISYAGDCTPKGGVSVTGARLQRVLNRAAYEDNVRHGAAGSAMTRALQGPEGDGERGKRTSGWGGDWCMSDQTPWCTFHSRLIIVAT